jgi:hypothetical protein
VEHLPDTENGFGKSRGVMKTGKEDHRIGGAIQGFTESFGGG